jgi:hypothetical protein
VLLGGQATRRALTTEPMISPQIAKRHSLKQAPKYVVHKLWVPNPMADWMEDLMSRKGLDESGREYIKSLVGKKATGEAVREAIRHRVRSTDFDYQNNVALLDWLRRNGYNDTANYLVSFLEGRA